MPDKYTKILIYIKLFFFLNCNFFNKIKDNEIMNEE
jgi:predicted KAP-like P-loop ATPase